MLEDLKVKGFMTKSTFHNETFRNNLSADRLNKALAMLMDNHMISKVTKDFDGRPMEGYEPE